MKGKKYILLKAKIPVWLKYWAYKKGGVTPTLKNLYLGYSRQETTTGKQLLNINDMQLGKSLRGSGVGANFTLDNNSMRATIIFPCNSNTEYTISINNNYRLRRLCEFDNDNLSNCIADHAYYSSGLKVVDTFTTNENSSYLALTIQANPEVDITQDMIDNCKLMFNLGAIQEPWERYTGGIPAPNPNYPIEIENLTGNVPIQAGNKVITFPLAEGQKLYRNSMLTPNGIVNTDSEFVLVGNENFEIGSTSGNKKIFYLDNVIYAKTFDFSQIQNILMLSNNFIKGTGQITTADIYTFWYNTTGRNLRFVMETTLSLEDFISMVTSKYNNGTPIKLQYELRTAETVAYTEAQLQAYTNLCKYFEENTDLNNYIVEGG